MSSTYPSPATVPDAVWRSHVRDARRVVVKVGSQVLCRADGTVDDAIFAGLCSGLAALLKAGREVVLVSSGAVALGRGVIGQAPGAADSDAGALGKQALAALGQGLLMSRYRAQLEEHDVRVAQILLTHSDLGSRQRFLHARRVSGELIAAHVLPIVNENDTVAVDEIRFGDNDVLAAQVAHLVGASVLLLLTEVAGLFTADPSIEPSAKLLRAVASDDERTVAIAGAGAGRFGTGGMRSKVLAARKAGELGVITVVADGRRAAIIPDVLGGMDIGTIFAPPRRQLSGKRKWIVSSVRTSGVVVVDEGAVRALRDDGRSLLPAGVVAIEGRFDVGDALLVRDQQGQPLGRGLSRYQSEDVRRVLGLRTEQIAAILGWLPAPELIHRDDFVIGGGKPADPC